MTPRSSALLIGAFAVMTAGVAQADNADNVVGRYEVKYEEVTSNCENTGMSMLRGVFEIEKKKASTVTIDIDRLPVMTGSANKGGRVKATSKLGRTSIQGLDGRFSVAGSVNDDGVLQMVLVAEYYLSGKAYCTQSWNVSGVRAGDPPKAKKTDTGDDASDAMSSPAMYDMMTRWLPPAD